MKLGYSLLLGELIESAQIAYDDCRLFQIVCPSCKEPVFKVERQQEPDVLHYLSHYERTKAYVDECELRVGGISSEEVLQRNLISRGQKLELFLRVLQDAIIETNVPDPKNRQRARYGAHKLACSRAHRLFCDGFLKDLRARDAGSRGRLVDEHVQHLLSSPFRAELPDSPLALSQSCRITKDLWSHLMSEKASGNLLFLLNEAWMCFHSRSLLAKEQGRSFSDRDQMLLEFVRLLPRSTPEQAMRMWDSLERTSIEGLTLGQVFMNDLTLQMVEILLRLPYFELLARAQTTSTNA